MLVKKTFDLKFSTEAKKSVEKFNNEGVSGVRMQGITVFSAANNRNKRYFDITWLILADDVATKLIFNLSHDQAKKLGGIKLNKLFNMRLEKGPNGYEIKADFESTDPALLEVLDQITGVSIEIMVDTSNIRVFEDGSGEFYLEIEFVGMAFLVGEFAGSGDTRIPNMETFSTNKTRMSKEEIQQLLQETFAANNEKLEAKFSQMVEKLLQKSQTNMNGEISWVGSDGKTYTRKWQDIYTEIVTCMEEAGNDNAPEVMDYIAKVFNLEAPKSEPKNTFALSDTEVSLLGFSQEQKKEFEAELQTMSQEDRVKAIKEISDLNKATFSLEELKQKQTGSTKMYSHILKMKEASFGSELAGRDNSQSGETAVKANKQNFLSKLRK
jgi:DNA-binding transcriptional MerR regulator